MNVPEIPVKTQFVVSVVGGLEPEDMDRAFDFVDTFLCELARLLRARDSVAVSHARIVVPVRPGASIGAARAALMDDPERGRVLLAQPLPYAYKGNPWDAGMWISGRVHGCPSPEVLYERVVRGSRVWPIDALVIIPRADGQLPFELAWYYMARGLSAAGARLRLPPHLLFLQRGPTVFALVEGADLVQADCSLDASTAHIFPRSEDDPASTPVILLRGNASAVPTRMFTFSPVTAGIFLAQDLLGVLKDPSSHP